MTDEAKAHAERLREVAKVLYYEMLRPTDSEAVGQAFRLIETQAREIERLRRTLNQIAWLAQKPYDPDEQLTGGEGCASEGQAGSEA